MSSLTELLQPLFATLPDSLVWFEHVGCTLPVFPIGGPSGGPTPLVCAVLLDKKRWPRDSYDFGRHSFGLVGGSDGSGFHERDGAIWYVVEFDLLQDGPEEIKGKIDAGIQAMQAR